MRFPLQTRRAHVIEQNGWESLTFGERVCLLNSSTCFLASPLENQIDGVLRSGFLCKGQEFVNSNMPPNLIPNQVIRDYVSLHF